MQSTTNYGLNKPDITDFYNVEDFNENADKIDAALAIKPENVSELFNFNKYDGDINSLAVGMYVYFRGDMYPSPVPSSTTLDTHEGWGKILSISASNGTCQIHTLQLFGEQTTAYIEYANANNLTTQKNFTKIDSIQLILTEQEAKYLGMLSSVWGATQGGLVGLSARTFSHYVTGSYGGNWSFSTSTNKSYIVTIHTGGADSSAWIITNDPTTNTAKAKELYDKYTAQSISISSNTVTINWSGGSGAHQINVLEF